MHTRPLSKFHLLSKLKFIKQSQLQKRSISGVKDAASNAIFSAKFAKRLTFFMSGLSKTRVIVAFHLDQGILKTTLISRHSKGIKMEHLQTFDSLDVKPLYILEPFLSHKSVKIITAIDSWNTLLREVTLKLSSRLAIHKTLPFQLESLLPFPLEEAIVHPFFKKLDKNTTAISLFATKTEHLEDHLNALKKLEITPDQVSCTPLALYHYARYAAPLESDLVVFHVGEEKSSYICISSNQLVISQSIAIGKKDFLEKTRELQRVSAYLTKKVTCSKAMLTGELTPSIEREIEEAWESHFSFIKNAHPSYAIPLGLCLQEGGVQFLQGPYQAPSLKQRKRKFAFSCLASSLVLCMLLLIGGTLLTKKREAALMRQLSAEFLEKPDLSTALDVWERKIKLQKKPSPFSLSVPLVSDCLAWISTHPKLEGIDIQKVHYTLTQFPQLNKEKEPYEAKVTLSFKATTPRQAREFHEVLMAGDSLINGKAPITWALHEEGYECSFYLTKKGGVK